ncbi:MAG TPA: hypothetical protein VMW69_14945 [Spirochaetia bacterium]|nr:hypothetical protein [Spirochaetia bacterium]
MHNLKRLLAPMVIFLLFGAFAAFANGQGESSNLTGTVSSIQPAGTSNQVNVVLTTKSGSYTVTVDQSVVSNAALSVGQTISLKGVVHQAADGGKSVDAAQVEVDGHQYSIANGGTSSGNGSGSAKEASDSPDKGGASAHKPETPEVSAEQAESPQDTESADAKTPDAGGGSDN